MHPERLARLRGSPFAQRQEFEQPRHHRARSSQSTELPIQGSQRGYSTPRRSHASSGNFIGKYDRDSEPADPRPNSRSRSISGPTESKSTYRRESPSSGWDKASTSISPQQLDVRSHSAPSQALPTSPSPKDAVPKLTQEQRKLDFLIRNLEEILEHQSGVAALRFTWSQPHSDMVRQLLNGLKGLHDPNFQTRAITSLEKAFDALTTCHVQNRIKPSEKETFVALRNDVIELIYDFCEDEKVQVRKVGYTALFALSKSDLTLVKRNCDVLVQLLQNDSPLEFGIINSVLSDHISLSPEDALEVIIDDHCHRNLRGLALTFLSSEKAMAAMAKCLGNVTEESKLAQRLARVMPLADRDDLGRISMLLERLDTLWRDPSSYSTSEEFHAAHEAGVSLLWSMCQILMRQSRTIRKLADEDKASYGLTMQVFNLLEKVPRSRPTQAVHKGKDLLQHLIHLSLGIGVPEASDACLKKSAAKLFVDELECCVRYLYHFLPPTTSSRTPTQSILFCFSPVKRVAFFRSAANLAVQVASAAAHVPNELGFSKDLTTREFANLGAEALKIFASESEARSADASQAVRLLIAEALLIMIDQVEAYQRASGASGNVITRDHAARTLVRDLADLGRKNLKAKTLPSEVLDAGELIIAFEKRHMRPLRGTPIDLPKPTWLLDPPTFPGMAERDDRTKKADEKTGNSESKKDEHKDRARSKRSPEGSPGKEAKRPRGRGTVMAPKDPAYAWDRNDDRPCVSQEGSRQQLSIRGAAGTPEGRSNGLQIHGMSRTDNYHPSTSGELLPTRQYSTYDSYYPSHADASSRSYPHERSQSSTYRPSSHRGWYSGR